MDMLEGRTKVHDYDLERLIMLTDGVFAIALTLLALELKAPPEWHGGLLNLWALMWRSVGAYLISFMAIAVYWASYRRSFKRYKRADGMLTLLNFVILGLITLLPMGTRLLMEAGPNSGAFLLYVGLIAAIGVANAIQWAYAAFIAKDMLYGHPSMLLKVVIFLIQLLVPSMMGTMGVLSAQPGYWWLYIVMAVVWIGVFTVRRRVARHDHF